MSGNIAIFWPMIVQAALTLSIYVVLFIRRQGAARSGVSFERMANGQEEPDAPRIAARHLANQYELPTLFFAVCLSLYVTNGATWFAVILAWVFVISRIVHSGVHLGPNILPLRGAVFGIGIFAIVVLWVVLAIHILNVGAVLGTTV